MSPSPLDWHGRFLEIETKIISVLGEQFLTNAIQTPYLCSITIGMVVCIYKGTTDLLNKILKSHSPLETNTWRDCSSCYIGNGFLASSNRKVTKKKITIDFGLLSFLIATLFVLCCAVCCVYSLGEDRKNHERLQQ